MKQKVLMLSVSLLTLVGGTALPIWVQHRPQVMTCATVPPPQVVTPVRVANYNPNLYAEDQDEWTRKLRRFREMPMRDLPGCEEESYRVVFIPSFHHPISVRIWRTGERFAIASKKLSLRNGKLWGKLIAEDTRTITDDEWLEATRLLRAAGVWGRPVPDPAALPNDGALWVIEARADGQSRAFFRRGADPTFREACKYLLTLSGWQTDAEKY